FSLSHDVIDLDDDDSTLPSDDNNLLAENLPPTLSDFLSKNFSCTSFSQHV
ncbi:28653_t:CDS:1, partial [Racocetra persica]